MAEIILAAPCCNICQHFRLSMGEQGYSELTPGSSAEITCEKRYKRGCAWPSHYTYPSVEIPALITVASRCKLFKLHPVLMGEE